jgi:hypothetical protein
MVVIVPRKPKPAGVKITIKPMTAAEVKKAKAEMARKKGSKK